MDQIYDVYIIKKSGIPLVTGCTATEYCQSNMGQHELQSGFLAALHSFASEAFDDESITSIEMKNIQMNFKVDESHEIIFAVVHSISSDKKEIHRKLAAGLDRFLQKFEHEINQAIIDTSIFPAARDLLFEVGLLDSDLFSRDEMQKAENSKKQKLLNWIRNIKPSYN
ncbi:MAG: hypothetical protein ACW98K_13010 [Candidatus Kariarchaeaceae archaeon]|jgi:hypothetical protein